MNSRQRLYINIDHIATIRQVTIVPERREEVTSEGGLDVIVDPEPVTCKL